MTKMHKDRWLRITARRGLLRRSERGAPPERAATLLRSVAIEGAGFRSFAGRAQAVTARGTIPRASRGVLGHRANTVAAAGAVGRAIARGLAEAAHAVAASAVVRAQVDRFHTGAQAVATSGAIAWASSCILRVGAEAVATPRAIERAVLGALVQPA